MTTKIDGPSPSVGRTVDASPGASVSRAGGDRSQPVSATAPSDSVRLTGEATGLQAAMEGQLGHAAGMDVGKVEAVRAAIADGSYRVDPQEVANRLLALERQMLG